MIKKCHNFLVFFFPLTVSPSFSLSLSIYLSMCLSTYLPISGVPRGGSWEVQPPPPEIPKAVQNRAKFNPIVKTVKNC